MLTRRQFSRSLLAGRTALLASETVLPPDKLQADSKQSSYQRPDKGPDQPYDLLIKGGTVIDSGQHSHAPLDIAVKGGKILEMARDIPESRALVVYSAKDKIVTPGFIDLHVHCFDGVGSGMNADHYSLGGE
jgi:hypothetical protein